MNWTGSNPLLVFNAQSVELDGNNMLDKFIFFMFPKDIKTKSLSICYLKKIEFLWNNESVCL